MEARGLSVLTGSEVEMVLTLSDGSPLPQRHWNAYGLSAALEHGEFLVDLVSASEEVGLPVEQVHAEYGDSQFELSLAPAAPLESADNVVLARIVAGRVARRHGMAVSLSPQPFQDEGVRQPSMPTCSASAWPPQPPGLSR